MFIGVVGLESREIASSSPRFASPLGHWRKRQGNHTVSISLFIRHVWYQDLEMLNRPTNQLPPLL